MDETKSKEKPLEDKVIQIIIPECCRGGWETCPHVPNRQKKVKQNIGV